MTQQIINIGAAPNDGTGDPARSSFDKCNLNFTELYQVSRPTGNAIEFQFNNTITEPPSVGQLRFNQATQASTTKLWVSHTTSSGVNIKQFLAAATTGAKLVVQDKIDNTNYIKFDVTAAPVDKTTYWEFAVAVTASGGNLPNAATLAAVTAAAGSAPQHGRLYYTSATALSFLPYGGNKIQIAGTLYDIPAAGIAGLGNGGLSANTTYYVYAFNSSGTITGEFSATTHAMSTTAGNVGVEIKSGDNTRTLIGMVRTNASAQFQNDNTQRLVISWFNRANVALVGASTASTTTTSTTPVELTPSARITFLNWAGEGYSVGTYGYVADSVANNTIGLTIQRDGTTLVLSVEGRGAITGIAGATISLNGAATEIPAEGYHYLTPMGFMPFGGATGTFLVGLNGMIRG